MQNVECGLYGFSPGINARASFSKGRIINGTSQTRKTYTSGVATAEPTERYCRAEYCLVAHCTASPGTALSTNQAHYPGPLPGDSGGDFARSCGTSQAEREARESGDDAPASTRR